MRTGANGYHIIIDFDVHSVAVVIFASPALCSVDLLSPPVCRSLTVCVTCSYRIHDFSASTITTEPFEMRFRCTGLLSHVDFLLWFLQEIKQNLDGARAALLSMRLEPKCRQQLQLILQRQHLEEEELRLRHYMELEKLEKNLDLSE